ncbi:MAG: hypothetical protein ACTSPD_20930 [Promethearchaeota archaeon]
MNKSDGSINIKKTLLIELIIFFIIRIPLFFIEKIARAADVIKAFLYGKYFYCTTGIAEHKWVFTEHFFPPLLYYLYTLEYLIFGDMINYINPFFLIFEFFNVILVYKMILLFNDEEDALLGILLVIFFPLSLIFLAFVEPSVFAMTFTLASLYLFLIERTILSSIFAALGTAVLFLPAIIILPIFLYYFKKGEIKSFISYILVFILTLLLIILPFLILCPHKFIQSMIISLNSPQSSNISYIILGDFSSYVVFSFLDFDLKLLTIIQICILLFAFLYLNKKYEAVNKKDVLIMTIFFFYLIMVITFYLHPRFIYWTFLIIIVILPYKRITESKDIEKVLIKTIIISIPYLVLSFFCLYYSRKFKLFNDFIIHMNLILLFLFLFSILWLIFAFFVFPKFPIIKKLIIYNVLAIIGFILYKLFYTYFELREFNIILSYLIIVLIIYMVYFLSFRFLDTYYLRKKTNILKDTIN